MPAIHIIGSPCICQVTDRGPKRPGSASFIRVYLRLGGVLGAVHSGGVLGGVQFRGGALGRCQDA
ncbi:hypothetical protein GCM10010298_33750 [Streptomyces microflavus]|nr:hypothetical protein GCM10010298_33750 [Streptomyces microflavus]